MFTSLVSRPTIRMTEVRKFQVMLKWATYKVASQLQNEERVRGENKCEPDEQEEMVRVIMNRLTRDLKLHKIPPADLIKVSSETIIELILKNVLFFQFVLPTKMIRHDRMLQTLLYQADSGFYGVAKYGQS